MCKYALPLHATYLETALVYLPFYSSPVLQTTHVCCYMRPRLLPPTRSSQIQHQARQQLAAQHLQARTSVGRLKTSDNAEQAPTEVYAGHTCQRRWRSLFDTATKGDQQDKPKVSYMKFHFRLSSDVNLHRQCNAPTTAHTCHC